MLDIKLIRSEPEKIKTILTKRRQDPSLIDQILSIDAQRREAIQKSEGLRAEQNQKNKDVVALKKEGKDASALLEQMKQMSLTVKKLQEETGIFDTKLQEIVLVLPNIIHDCVTTGDSSEDNKVINKWGEPKKFNFKVKDHVDLGQDLNILDFERAAKISGARFSILKGKGAKLERALINYFLDKNGKAGYEETLPPFMVNSNALLGTGQLPKFKEDLFHMGLQNYFLVPTAEVPVTNYYAGEILNESDLPIYLTAYTPCFRSEAGSHGRDVRGLIRQHQFDKVEMVKFVHPEKSYEEHDKLKRNAEEILEELELPYQTVALCSGDIGHCAAKCYDLEVWLPSQNAYREISSCSNFEDYQARRANIKFRDASGKVQSVHTINGSGLAVGRTWLAILENYQQEDGSVIIPKVLRSYTGFDRI